MKSLIPLLVAFALTGCDQASDVSQSQGSEPGTDLNQAAADSHQPAIQEYKSAKNAAPVIPWGMVKQYGLFRERGRGWTQQDADSSTGKLIRNPKLEFEQQTDRIPLRKGVYFGYRYKLKVEPDKSRADLRRVLMHPEMILPDGSRVSRSERSLRKRSTYGIVTALDGYALNEDYELVEGDWTFQIWYEDNLLVEQAFTTYWPEETAEPDAGDTM